MSAHAREDVGGIMRSIVEDDDDEGRTMAQFAAWMLADAGADDWHRVLMAWNWDNGEDVPLWIASQPDCDRATALLAFWNAQPEYYLKYRGDRGGVAAHETGGFDLIQTVRSRWRDGRYRRAEIAFSLDEPCTWQRDFAALEEDFGEQVAIDLPLDMRQPLAGRRLDSGDMIEGIPSRFWPAGSR